MRTKKLLFISLVSILLVFSCSIFTMKKHETNHVVYLKDYSKLSVDSPSCVKMYEVIEKYSDEYSIPKHIIYNIAFIETKYHGPFDWSYKHNLGSYAGALGPMQIMPSTARFIHNKQIPKNVLKNDIELNVRTSAILLNKLYGMYKDWGKVCGAYNTGRPIINKYSKFCTSNIQYWKNWYLFLCVD